MRRGDLGPVLSKDLLVEYVAATSSTKTPAGSGQWHQHTGNSIVLSQGSWLLKGTCNFSAAGGSPAYSNIIFSWRGANGADSGSAPAAITTLSGLTVEAGLEVNDWAFVGAEVTRSTTTDLRITTSQANTVYLTTFSSQSTSANARITLYLWAERIA